MNNKRKHAEYLLDEIGLIDENLIADAENYRPKNLKMMGIITAAAALAAVVSLFIGLKIATAFFDMIKRDAQKETSPSSTVLAEVIDMAEKNAGGSVTHTKKVELFDGKTKLVWQYEGEDIYRFVNIGISSVEQLMNSSTLPLSDNQSDAVLCRIWITLGDGRVITPHLIPSPGNIGYGELFDYLPELQLGDEALRIISRSIENET